MFKFHWTALRHMGAPVKNMVKIDPKIMPKRAKVAKILVLFLVSYLMSDQFFGVIHQNMASPNIGIIRNTF